MHSLVPPCVLTGGSPCPEQDLGGWGDRAGTPRLFPELKTALREQGQGMLLLVREGFPKGLVHSSSRA